MDRITKMKSLSLAKASAEADIGLINQYALRELAPDDVFTYSVILCDNEVDRSYERFTDETLHGLAELFTGRVGIKDHEWSADNQLARLYRTEVVELDGLTELGDQKLGLRGDFYMLRDGNEKNIAAIEGGILKEVSVGCSIGMQTCSVCGGAMKFSLDNWGTVCENGHIPGKVDKEGRLCVVELSQPLDAYEVSFVAVPCQPGAGVIKSFDGGFDAFMAADWAPLGEEKIKAIIGKANAALLSEEELKKRAEIIEEYSKLEF